MHYFFFDAAGDPGFQISKSPKGKGGGSKPFYVLCVISTNNNTSIQLKLNDLRHQWGMNPVHEFKFHTLDRKKRQPFFQNFANHNFTGYVTVLPKATSTQVLTLEQLKNGNKVTSTLIAPIISKAVCSGVGTFITNFHFYVDEEKYNRTVRDGMRASVSDEMRKLGIDYTFKLSPENSKKEQSLQLADMVAGMVMDSFETGDQQLLNIIKHNLLIDIL